MEPYRFDDALTGKTVVCTYPGLQVQTIEGADSFFDGADSTVVGDVACESGAPAGDAVCESGAPAVKPCTSLFFPGCSLVNYGLPLVKAVYDLLQGAGCVDGMSLLCCGKILTFEPDGQRVRAAFEQQMRDHVAAAGVRRIVAACPNCVAALRAALAQDSRTSDVSVVVLPEELAALGYRIDEGVLRRMVAAEASVSEADVAVCVHDSCSDRETGEFADGTRALLPQDLLVEAAHIRNRSFCCGSLVRAAGKVEAAEKQARRHGEEAEQAHASAIVTACVSCAFMLSVAQHAVPVFHYLELLYDWRINWAHVDQYMKLRFLFDDASDEQASGRAFVGLEGVCAAAASGPEFDSIAQLANAQATEKGGANG